MTLWRTNNYSVSVFISDAFVPMRKYVEFILGNVFLPILSFCQFGGQGVISLYFINLS
jgi:hypothetical protein